MYNFMIEQKHFRIVITLKGEVHLKCHCKTKGFQSLQSSGSFCLPKQFRLNELEGSVFVCQQHNKHREEEEVVLSVFIVRKLCVCMITLYAPRFLCLKKHAGICFLAKQTHET